MIALPSILAPVEYMIHTLLQLLVSFGLAILSRKNGVNEKWSTKEYEAEKQKEISKLNKS